MEPGPARRPRIYVIDLREDDPSKCTAKRMVRAGMAIETRRPPRGTLLLDPYSRVPLSPVDRNIVEARGVTVVDASWRQLNPSRFRKLIGRSSVVRRRLPLLFAANPAHYGVAFKLSSLEAVAAALYITGFRDEAERLAALYKWGWTFLALNRELLEEYSRAREAREVLAIEAEVLSRILEREVRLEDVPELIEKLARASLYEAKA